MNPRSFLPNALTLSNLMLGILGIVFSFQGALHLSAYCIVLAAVFDLLDGLVARLVNGQSEIGAQLDSLADMVSFGVLPGILIFQLLRICFSEYYQDLLHTENGVFYAFGLLIPLFAATRLAIFNTSNDQQTDFKGMPTPAIALGIASIIILIDQELKVNTYVPIEMKTLDYLKSIYRISSFDYKLYTLIMQPLNYMVLAVFCAISMVLPLRFISFKFKGFNFRKNLSKYLLILGALLILGYCWYVRHFFMAFALIFVWYFVASVLHNFISKS